MSKSYYYICASCGKKGSVLGTLSTNPKPSHIQGKCPNTKDGKHVELLQEKK